jgi:hypothetical protein
MVNWGSSPGNSGSLGLVGHNMDVASRIFIAVFGLAWFALSNLNLGMGMRELSFSYREWMYVLSMINALILASMSIIPRSILNYGFIRGGYFVVISFIEYELALIIHKNILRLYGFYQSLHAGTEMFPERAPAKMIELGIAVAITAIMGVALALSAARLLLRPKKSLPH